MIRNKPVSDKIKSNIGFWAEGNLSEKSREPKNSALLQRRVQGMNPAVEGANPAPCESPDRALSAPLSYRIGRGFESRTSLMFFPALFSLLL